MMKKSKFFSLKCLLASRFYLFYHFIRHSFHLEGRTWVATFSTMLTVVLVVGCSDSDRRSDAIEMRDGAVSNGKDADVVAKEGSGTEEGKGTEEENSCVYSGPSLIELDDLEECDLCRNAHCISEDLVDSDFRDDLADCEDDGDKCVPDMYLETGGSFLLESCKSIEGVEGRCVSLCIPRVAAQQDILPRDDCRSDERCAPCYDPITGEDTGSCHISCDSGPKSKEDPFVFDECCDGLSVCIPDDLVSSDDRSNFSDDGCENDDELCIPKEMAADPNGYVPETCEGWDGSEGRCLPACIPEVARVADMLLQDDCPKDYLCAPCYDPITGSRTMACTLPGDSGPEDSAYTFDECCDGLSVCVPEDAVPAGDRSRLDQDSCRDADALCVPKEMASDPINYVPETCDSWGGAEGRCLPACLPDVAEDADRLTQDICPNGYLCAPCNDPLTGNDTEACSIANDPGPEDPSFTFPECCEGLALCVPEKAVPEESRTSLGPDDCKGVNELCLPRDLASDPTGYTAETCKSWGGAEGRCLPACLPDVAKDAARLSRDDCPKGYLCAPCYDQVTGEETQACSIASDPGPKDTAYTFDECCDGISVCVPKEAVPASNRASFDSESCKDNNDLCIPKDIASDPSGYVAESCTSWGGAEGRCLPVCLSEVAKDAERLSQDTCDDNFLCVPCNDQITGEATSACTIAGDPGPSRSPVIFDECCDGISICVPVDAVPSDDRTSFNGEGCSGSDLCIPIEIAENPSGYVAESCRSWNGAEARCLPACLPEVMTNAARVAQETCPDDYLCLPCYDHVTQEDTHACSIAGDVGPQQDPNEYAFSRCCGGNSVCTPLDAIADDLEHHFTVDSCSGSNVLCVPEEIALNPEGFGSERMHCTSWGGSEGRCLFSCLPEVAEVADELTQDICAEGMLCVPCYDPVTGELTDSCTGPGDAPSKPAYTFPRCCIQGANPRGVCVPSALAAGNESLLAELPDDGCAAKGPADEEFICVPTEFAQDPDLIKPSNCTVSIIVETDGLCMADCFSTNPMKSPGDLQGSCTNPNDECLPCSLGAPCE